MTLAEQLGISLTIAFSEATQPLTLTSTDDNAEDGFTIFCAIATTTSDAFADVRHTASNSVSAVGPDRKVTRTPSAVDQPTGSRRNRPSSEQPRKRPSLDFGGNLPAAVVVNSAPAIPRTGRMQEPLFLPSADKESDSQAPDAGPSDYGETVPFPPLSQKIRMSQKEVMEASGLGDLGSDELFNELDDAEEEEERLGIGMGGIDTTGGDEEGTASRTFPLGETGAESMIQRDLPTLDHDAVDEDPLEERLGVTEDNELEADDTQELPPSQSEPNHREVCRINHPERVLMTERRSSRCSLMTEHVMPASDTIYLCSSLRYIYMVSFATEVSVIRIPHTMH